MSPPTQPSDIATRETVRFLSAHVPRGARVIEVGCGHGAVAFALHALGYEVIALDSDADAVAIARERGVDARVASWPDCDVPAAGAIAFTRSLHHIAELDRSVDRAREILEPSGLVLLEDFAHEIADESGLRGLRGLAISPPGAGLIVRADDELVTDLVGAHDVVAVWRHRHAHDPELHSFAALEAAIAERFDVRATERVPYLYRYLTPVLPATEPAARWVERVLNEETRRGACGEIALIGPRLIAFAES